ncbi:TM0996/MTH895 family glutaredoxin-like protein [candidate division KSB1 bacterium]|nr:TM0996/MTH895 family glutaredoxin-like protein [candidate division KSB1 bacterium]
MNVKVLGTGCSKCKLLEERIKKVAAENNIDIDLEKVTNINDIMSFGVMLTPGLVVDGEVKTSGKIPSEDQVLSWIQ